MREIAESNSLESEKRIQRNKAIREEIIGIFKANGLCYAEAEKILSGISWELKRMSERNRIQ